MFDKFKKMACIIVNCKPTLNITQTLKRLSTNVLVIVVTSLFSMSNSLYKHRCTIKGENK